MTEHEWSGIDCPVCGKPFTAASWDTRHTVPFGRHAGEDCHARCCPAPDCKQTRNVTRRAARAAQGAQP